MLSASIIPGVYAGKSWAQASMRDLELCGGKGAEHGGRGCGRGFELGLRCLWPWFGLSGCSQVFSSLRSRHNFPVTHLGVGDRRWAASFRVQFPATVFSTLLRSSVAPSRRPSSAVLQALSSTTIFVTFRVGRRRHFFQLVFSPQLLPPFASPVAAVFQGSFSTTKFSTASMQPFSSATYFEAIVAKNRHC